MEKFIKVLDKHLDRIDSQRIQIINNDNRTQSDYFNLRTLDDQLQALRVLRHEITAEAMEWARKH